MLVQLFFGLFVLKAVAAGPRFSRQADLDSYDSNNYDVDLDNQNLENQDIYDYEEGLTIDDPQVRNCSRNCLFSLLHNSVKPAGGGCSCCSCSCCGCGCRAAAMA